MNLSQKESLKLYFPLIAAIVLFLFALIFIKISPVFVSFMLIFLEIITGIYGVRLYKNSFTPRNYRNVWGLIGIAILAEAVGDIIWFFIAYILHNAVKPIDIPDIFYAVYYIAILYALFLLIGRTGKLFEEDTRVQKLWGAGALFALVFSIYIALFSVSALKTQLGAQFVNIGYLAGDIFAVVLTITLLIGFKGGKIVKAWYYMVVASVILGFSDILFVILRKVYVLGSPVDLLWMIGIGFLLASMIIYRKIIIFE